MQDSPLRRYRVSQGLTLAQAAEQIGVSEATLSRVETESGEAGPQLLRRIAKWSNNVVTPNDVMNIKPAEGDQAGAAA